jgi:hypothetical protein
MAENREQSTEDVTREHAPAQAAELKYVAVEVDDQTVGGWYREIDATEIEVLSRAQLERVPVEDMDAEMTARGKIAQSVERFGSLFSGKTH